MRVKSIWLCHCSAALRIVCFHEVWPYCSTAYWGCFRTYSELMLLSAVWWCFTSAVVVLVQRGLALNCPVGKYIHFPMLPACVCEEYQWVIPLDCIMAPLGICSSLGVLGVFLFSQNCCVAEDNRVCWQPCRWHNSTTVCGVAAVFHAVISSPQLMCLRYSIWLLYCRSAIVLMTLETHAVTLPQVLTPCSNHHTQLWGVHPAVDGCAHRVSSFWSVSHALSVFLLLSLGLCCFMQRGWVSSGCQLAVMVYYCKQQLSQGTSRLIVSIHTSVGNTPSILDENVNWKGSLFSAATHFSLLRVFGWLDS